jgi:hypothetical protein
LSGDVAKSLGSSPHARRLGGFAAIDHSMMPEASMTDASPPPHRVVHRTQAADIWKRLWHLTTVIFPRRSITGRLVRGRVWRRHDGRRWIYKAFVELDEDRHH